jgi:hypothetical protein
MEKFHSVSVSEKLYVILSDNYESSMTYQIQCVRDYTRLSPDPHMGYHVRWILAKQSLKAMTEPYTDYGSLPLCSPTPVKKYVE